MGVYVSNLTDEEFPVIAFDYKTGEYIGTFENQNKATKLLYIRSSGSISGYIKSKVKRKGVSNYKNEREYHFELLKYE